MEIRDEILKDNLTKEQKMNKFYSKLVLATFKANLEPKVADKLVKEAERLGIGEKEIGELAESISKQRNLKSRKIYQRYLQSALTQIRCSKILKDSK